MKLIRFRDGNNIIPGILDKENKIRNASSWIKDWDHETIRNESLDEIKLKDIYSLPLATELSIENAKIDIAPCIAKQSIGKFICIGLNYSDHAAETGMQVPPEPIIFFKATSSVIGPNDNVHIPRSSIKSDWEVELGVIVGKEAKYIRENESQDHIAGYCVVNDLSERTFQIERSGQWVKGKSCDTFGPIGPYLVTKEEILDPQNLKLWLDINGKRMQDGSTKTMVYGVNFLISYISQFMSLQPGDIISTGTPPGVGMGMKPQIFLKPGDVIELGVEGLGKQKQKTIAA